MTETAEIAAALGLTRPLVVIDTETTGTDPATDRIVQFAWVKIEPDGGVTEGEILIDPEEEIPAAATAVHGIGAADVTGKPTFREAAPRIAAAIRGADIAGYNAGFDISVLSAEIDRMGGKWERQGGAVVDPCAIFKSRERRDLSSAVRFYLGEEPINAHTAIADARYTARVLAAQLKRYPDLPRDVAGLAEIGVQKEKMKAGPGGRVLMGFGKHKGKEIGSVPSDYLRWILDADFKDHIKAMVRTELAKRGER